MTIDFSRPDDSTHSSSSFRRRSDFLGCSACSGGRHSRRSSSTSRKSCNRRGGNRPTGVGKREKTGAVSGIFLWGKKKKMNHGRFSPCFPPPQLSPICPRWSDSTVRWSLIFGLNPCKTENSLPCGACCELYFFLENKPVLNYIPLYRLNSGINLNAFVLESSRESPSNKCRLE